MRVGLTGLGVVFLITLGAAFAFGSADDRGAVPDNKPGEPLAQLGVAPGAEKVEPADGPQNPQPGLESAPEASGTTIVPPPQNAPEADSLALPVGISLTSPVSI